MQLLDILYCKLKFSLCSHSLTGILNRRIYAEGLRSFFKAKINMYSVVVKVFCASLRYNHDDER